MTFTDEHANAIAATWIKSFKGIALAVQAEVMAKIIADIAVAQGEHEIITAKGFVAVVAEEANRRLGKS